MVYGRNDKLKSQFIPAFCVCGSHDKHREWVHMMSPAVEIYGGLKLQT